MMPAPPFFPMASPNIAIRPRRSLAFFALLSIVMVMASYVFVVLLAAACVYLPYLLIDENEPLGLQTIALLIFGIMIAATMLWSLLPRRDKFKAPGLRLDRATQPRLFTEIEKIAAALNEPMPSEVYLIGDVNAFVADRGGFLGRGSRRIMGIGLPLLSILTVSQFRAVLAHEFAHYYGGDTRLGPWVQRTQSAIVRIFQNIGSIAKVARIAVLGLMYMVVATLMKWYFQLFLRAINLASRQREYRADELACMIAGRQPLIDGLRAIHGAAMAWPAFWETELAPVLNSGALPGIVEGFARFVSVPVVSDQIQKGIARQIEAPKSNPYDSHPPLRNRIDAARKIPRDVLARNPLREDSQPARTLLEQPDTIELQFLEGVNPRLKPGSLQSISWDEVGARVTIPTWRSFVAEYSSLVAGITAVSLPDVVPNLRNIGDSMRDPKGLLLDPQQRARRAGHLFAAALSLALLDRGWQLVTGPGSHRLRGPGGDLNLFLEIEKLASGKTPAGEWVIRCRTLGIADVVLAPPPPPQPGTASQPAASQPASSGQSAAVQPLPAQQTPPPQQLLPGIESDPL
jgi:heat shock protein HtpX